MLTFPKKTQQAMLKDFQIFSQRFDAISTEVLSVELEESITHARQSAGYVNRSFNLDSSIGGGVSKDGKEQSKGGFETMAATATKGANTGKEFYNEVKALFRNNIVMILVAGMEYASWLQNGQTRHGTVFNVLKKTELWLNSRLNARNAIIDKKMDKVYKSRGYK